MTLPKGLALCLLLCHASVALAQDAEGCKDHPLFNRMPGFELSRYEAKEFDLAELPRGPVATSGEPLIKTVEVEGKVTTLWYQLKEGAARPSGLQVMRNYQNAEKKYGGTVEGDYPGWCKGQYEAASSGGGTIRRVELVKK